MSSIILHHDSFDESGQVSKQQDNIASVERLRQVGVSFVVLKGLKLTTPVLTTGPALLLEKQAFRRCGPRARRRFQYNVCIASCHSGVSISLLPLPSPRELPGFEPDRVSSPISPVHSCFHYILLGLYVFWNPRIWTTDFRSFYRLRPLEVRSLYFHGPATRSCRRQDC